MSRIYPLCAAALALWAAPAGAVVMAPAIDESPLAALVPAWSASAAWDSAPPLSPRDAAPAADLFAPGAARADALPWDTLTAGNLDFAAPPDPRSGEPKLTKFLAALFAILALAKYLRSRVWEDVLSEIYYPPSY